MTQNVNTNWNQYEAAILVDAYWRIRDGYISKQDAVMEVSNRLRYAMVSQGVVVDPIYRNPNGINMQLSAVEYVLTDGLHGIHNAGKVISDVANMSLDSPEEYEDILAQAKEKYPLAPDSFGTSYIPKAEGLDENTDSTQDINLQLLEVLKNEFTKGFRMTSFIHKKRLSESYKNLVGEPLEEIELNELSAYGVIYKDTLYLPEQLLDEESKEELMSYITQYFESGRTFIYYSVLFEHFNEMFSQQLIFGEEMLHQYLLKCGNKSWFYREDMITSIPETLESVDKIVEIYVQEFGTIISYQELTVALDYIPREKVLQSVRQSPKIISGGRELCFHIDNFDMDNKDLFMIEQALNKTINLSGYATKDDLERIIKAVAPSVWENNIALGELSIRNVLSYKLQDKFSFVRNLISSKEHRINSNKAIDYYCRSHESTTMDELKAFCQECGSDTIRYDIASNYYVRVRYDLFIHRSQVQFDTDAIDEVIEKFTTKMYASITEVILSSLPTSQYAWNEYLLESYLALYSTKFTLFHTRYSQDNVTGAIVKKAADFKDYNDVITLILAESRVNLSDKTEALNYLADKQYIAFRRYKDLEKILVRAQELRNKLKKK